MYSAPEIVAIFAGIVTVIAALGATIVNVIVALRQGAKMDVAIAKTNGLISQVQEVHTVVNSNLAIVKAELSTALAQIAALTDLVKDLRAEREKAAFAMALATPAPVRPGRTGDGLPVVQQVEVVKTPPPPRPDADGPLEVHVVSPKE